MPQHPTPDQQFALNYVHHYLQKRGHGDVTIEIVTLDEIESERKQSNFATDSARPGIGMRRDAYHDRPLRDNEVEFRPRQAPRELPSLGYRAAASDDGVLGQVADALRKRNK